MKGQGSLVALAILFSVLTLAMLAVYISSINAITRVVSDSHRATLLDSVKRLEMLNVTVDSVYVTASGIELSIEVRNVGSTISSIRYAIIQCIDSQVRELKIYNLSIALVPGQSATETILFTNSTPCRTIVVTAVTRLGNSFTSVMHVG